MPRDAITHNCCLSLPTPPCQLRIVMFHSVYNCPFYPPSELFCVWRLLWAVSSVSQPAPPEAEALRDVLGDCGEAEDIQTGDWHHPDTQPTTGGWLMAWNGKKILHRINFWTTFPNLLSERGTLNFSRILSTSSLPWAYFSTTTKKHPHHSLVLLNICRYIFSAI